MWAIYTNWIEFNIKASIPSCQDLFLKSLKNVFTDQSCLIYRNYAESLLFEFYKQLISADVFFIICLFYKVCYDP